MTKKTLLILGLFVIAILSASPFLAGIYTENALKNYLLKSLADVQIIHYQRGYFHSQAEINIEGQKTQLTLTHAPIIFTGTDIARGNWNNDLATGTLNLDWQGNYLLHGDVSKNNIFAGGQLSSTGKIFSFPENSDNKLEIAGAFNHATQTQLSPMTVKIKIENEKIYLDIQNFNMQQNFPDGKLITLSGQNIITEVDNNWENHSINHLKNNPINPLQNNKNNKNFTAEKMMLTVNLPNLFGQNDQVKITLDNVKYQQNFYPRSEQDYQFEQHLITNVQPISTTGSLQWIIAPFYNLIPDYINHNMTISGLNSESQNLTHLENDWLSHDLTVSVDTQLLRRNQGLKIKMTLKENINSSNFYSLDFITRPEDIYPLFNGSQFNIEIAKFITDNNIIRSILPTNELRHLGFIEVGNVWLLRARIENNQLIVENNNDHIYL